MIKSIEKMNPRLRDNQIRLGHPLCAGFDPAISDLHPFLKEQLDSRSRQDFLMGWFHAFLDGISETCGSIKFQSAFFESLGIDGHIALKKMILESKQKNLYVILDCKRGDISSTMEAYGSSAFDELEADALTILPWMGLDVLTALTPWLKRGHGVYTVWLSSNKAGRILQETKLANQQHFAHFMLQQWEEWISKQNFADQCGYVFGATDIPTWAIDALSARRHSLLMPGIGAQGGQITDTLKKLVGDQHAGSLLPLSRALLKPTTTTKINNWSEYTDNVKRSWDQYILDWKNTR